MAELMACSKCGGKLQHLHDCAYGMPQTHMNGTERYECQSCGHAIFAEEGKAIGLKFVLDGKG